LTARAFIRDSNDDALAKMIALGDVDDHHLPPAIFAIAIQCGIQGGNKIRVWMRFTASTGITELVEIGGYATIIPRAVATVGV